MRILTVIPEWNSSIHEQFIRYAIEDKYSIYSAKGLYQRTLQTWLLALIYFPMMFSYLCFKNYKHLSIRHVNIGKPIIQEVIRNSKRAKFYHASNFILICKVYIKAIAIYCNFRKLKTKHPNLKVIGGDSAYVTFSVISQMVHDSIYIVAQDLVSISKFDKKTLSASGAHRWLNPLDYGCTSDGLTPLLKEDFQKPKIYMKRKHRKIYQGNYLPRCIYIYMHDFFDSPGVYGDTVFTDHVEWVDELIKLCNKYALPVKIKRHPNERKESIFVAKQFDNRCEHIHGDLDFEKVVHSNGVICTVYGTISNEAYLNYVNVIACGNGPFNGLPNVKVAHDKLHLELIISKLASTNFIQKNYSIRKKQNREECYTILGPSKFNYGFNLPYNDCWETHWRSFMTGDYPNDTFIRRKRLKNMNRLELQKFEEFLSQSYEFQHFKKFILKILNDI
ncbi:hypothetical protein OAD25_03085 [Gammaproteobacteria bacterium]|nr:hypothetical protein [Gammaproteobacteria bacterium]